MSFSPLQRSLWHCNRDTDGRKNICKFRCHKTPLSQEKLIEKGHWFLIISKKPTQEFVTALPLTSQDYQKELNEGEILKSEDVTDSIKSKNTFQFKRDNTYILCNKPCRIPVEDFKENEDYGFVKRNRYKDIILGLTLAMNPK